MASIASVKAAIIHTQNLGHDNACVCTEDVDRAGPDGATG
jgi:hypothetical protein